MMSDQLKENIQNLIHYYNHHGIEQMVKTHPSFVVEDFTKLLKELESVII